MNNLTRQQSFIINVFIRERTVPKTVRAIGEITGAPYKSQSFVRKVVRQYRLSKGYTV